MTFEELQKGILKVAELYSERFGVTIDQDFALLKLVEEVGEYAQAVLVHRKKSKPEKLVSENESKKLIANELADIIGLAIMNANLFDIDLENTIKEKWLNKT
jgi:NTP pyrophosphatase (non-canonical NTP hydrolase)